MQLERQPVAHSAGEDRAVDGDADRTPERTEQVCGRCSSADLSRLDSILDRDHQDLRDHPESDPEDHHEQRRVQARAGGAEGREEQQADAHCGKPEDRKDLVAARLRHELARRHRADRARDEQRQHQQARASRAGRGHELQEQRQEHDRREQRDRGDE